MAKNSTNNKDTVAAKRIEPLYSVAELANAARSRFGTTPEVVTVALKTAGKDKATVAETKLLIKALIGRKVN